MRCRLVCLMLTMLFIGTSHAQEKEQVYLPASPASIPLILALSTIPELEAHTYVNHSQANALFIRGDVPLLLTGLSVGRKLYEQGVPLSFVSSHITGFSHLVSTKGAAPLHSFTDLVGKKLWLPFPGSPLEEVCGYFAKVNGVQLGTDIEVGYTSFPAMVQLLETGKIEYAVLPEPFVSVAEDKGAIKVQLSLAELWSDYTGEAGGYPQVVLVAQQKWLAENPALADKLREALEQNVGYVQRKPREAVEKTKDYFTLSVDLLVQALSRTTFTMLYGEGLKAQLKDYYHKIGKDVGDDFEAVY